MKKIILDTNFLLIPFTMKVDIFTQIDTVMDEPYKLYIVDKTLDELEDIMENQGGKDKQAAKFALELLNAKEVEIIDTKINDNDVDSEILALCGADDYIVATQDKKLKELLIDTKKLVLRQKNHLEILP